MGLAQSTCMAKVFTSNVIYLIEYFPESSIYTK